MHCRSLMSSSRLPQTQISPSKSRSKLEALDTLVISTIHNVSNKLCSNSAGVLRQAAAIFPEPEEEQVMFLSKQIAGSGATGSHNKTRCLSKGHSSLALFVFPTFSSDDKQH